MSADWFAGRLRELRETAGLSRKELAERAGLQSEAGIRNLEQGIRKPTWETVLAICQALGVSCEEFRKAPDEGTAEPRKAGRPRKTPAAQEEGEVPPVSPTEGAAQDRTPQRAGDRPKETATPAEVEGVDTVPPVAGTSATETAGQEGEVKPSGQKRKPRKRRDG